MGAGEPAAALAAAPDDAAADDAAADDAAPDDDASLALLLLDASYASFHAGAAEGDDRGGPRASEYRRIVAGPRVAVSLRVMATPPTPPGCLNDGPPVGCGGPVFPGRGIDARA